LVSTSDLGTALTPYVTNATLTTNYYTITDADSAISTAINTLSTTVGQNTTAVQTNSTSINGLQGQYSVKIDNNGYVTGFGLSSTPVDGTPFSEMIVRADRFSIGSGNTDIIPFVVTTAATILNGVSVPAGVYIEDAYIKNGAISNAKIGNAAIDNAKIANAAIDNAKIADATIGTAKIQNAAITNALIANAAIDNAKIANAAIDSAKIQDAAISNAKIADATIDSAKIANAAITNALIANAAIDSAKIANAAIDSAKIQDASIISAKIGTAAVDTLKIANQAVTIPSSAYTSANYSISQSSVSWFTVQSLTYTSTGAPTQINFVCGLDVGLSFGGGIEVEFALFRGTTLLEEFVGSGGEAEIKTCVSIAYLDTNTTAGARTYYVKARRRSGISSVASKRSLTTLEVKR
jgi:hypothetical protein